jgi:membrane-associated phospholipid phosphatase
MKAIVRFDTEVTEWVQSMPGWFSPIMNITTLLGSAVAVFITLGSGYLLSDTKKGAFIFIAVAVLLNFALKQFIHRPRPDTLYVSLMRFKTHSFPSGHAFGSITAYGFVSYLGLLHLQTPLNILLAGLLWLLIIFIGLSRIYLGAHYTTDVIGGWILGSLCVMLVVKLF